MKREVECLHHSYYTAASKRYGGNQKEPGKKSNLNFPR
jgi:hypothetical protein